MLWLDLQTNYTNKGYALNPVNKSAQQGAQQAQVVEVLANSKELRAGTVFVALQGSHVDAHQFIGQALESGVTAIIAQDDRLALLEDDSWKESLVPVYTVKASYQAFALLNALLAGLPGEHLNLIGVTGTNGKTTVTHLVEAMLSEAGQGVGLIGTLGARTAKVGDQYASTGHTTPMANELQARLSEMKQAGLEAVVMEVSSHALQQHRVAGCPFKVAVHTNLTQDHLDFHVTMQAYFEAKALLFTQLQPGAIAVINQDDAYGEAFTQKVPAGVALWQYGLEEKQTEHHVQNRLPGAKTVLAKHVAYSITGARYTAVTPVGEFTVQLKMAGQFSVYNSLAALATGLALGLPIATCKQALEQTAGVRGRFEVVSQEPYVIVDYAHTPDGLENVLEAARKVLPEGGKLFAVFGCGGDRDATKRPKMGAIVERLADCLVVTSDNPRSEDPQQIISDILTGLPRFEPDRMKVEPDRRQAIRLAVDWAKANDVIVLAGKGHEDYQILADRVIHFDDREEVQQYLAQRQAVQASQLSVS